MDLFSITCTTCKSRLRVREESAVGQILACPKCGGMVMVKAPEGWEPGEPVPPPRAEPPAGATAIVEMKRKDETSSDSDFSAIDDILSAAPSKPKQPVMTVAADAPGLARPRFAGNPNQTAAGSPPGGKSNTPAQAAGVVPAGTSVTTASATTASAAAANAATTEPPVVKGRKSSSAARASQADRDMVVPDFRPRPTRTWSLWMAVSVLAGIALAIAVVVASANFFGGEPKQAATNPVPEPSPGRQTVPVQPTDAAGNSDPGAPTQPAAATQPLPDATSPMPPAPQPTSDDEPPKPAGPPPPTPPKAEVPFAEILAPESDPLPPKTEQPTAKPEASPPDLAAEEMPARPIVPRPEPREVDVTARLADPLAALQTEGTPLADFLQVMSDLSTIPITLEPDGLPLAQASAASPVVLRLSASTIDGALAAGLKRLGLEHVPVEGQLLVRLIEPAQMPVLSYPHRDLTGGDAAAAADLAELIQAVVDPPSWTLGEAGASIEVADTLRIKQRRANHAQIFLLCEKLRTARKLPYASKYPPALFQLDSRTKQATPRLKTPVSLNFHQPLPLVKILEELAQAANSVGPAARGPGLRILVDWRDIAVAGWNPDAVTTLVVENDSLAMALQKLLEPMDLAWRVVDGQTIQVVSPATLASRPEIELFPVGDLTKDDPTGGQLMAGIRETLGDDLFRDAGGPCELRFDLAGQCLVAALPQPKQQDLEVYLMSLRRPQ